MSTFWSVPRCKVCGCDETAGPCDCPDNLAIRTNYMLHWRERAEKAEAALRKMAEASADLAFTNLTCSRCGGAIREWCEKATALVPQEFIDELAMKGRLRQK